MDTFRIDYDKIDVEAIMAQIRQRVREKKEVLYSEAELERLGGLELPPSSPPEPKDVERDALPLPEVPERREVARTEERIAERMKDVSLDDIKDEDFVTEALRCVGEWNIALSVEDLYRSSPGIKGKIIQGIRAINRRLFKMVMNIDVLFPQLHKQAILNQTYVVLLHTLVQELSLLNNKIDRLAPEVSKLQAELTTSVESLDADLKQTRAELVRDIMSDKNDFSRGVNQLRNDIEKLEYKIDGLRGVIEGQKHQIEYLQSRQGALEQLAVLKDEESEAPARKTGELERGRYQGGKGKSGKQKK